MTDWDLPSLQPDRLATILPTRVYGGGLVIDPATTLFIWRTARLSHARGCVLGFYVDDSRFEALWHNPERATARLLSAGIAAVIEPDFSLWVDAPLVEQLWNVYRMRTLGRLWQEHGLPVIPNLAWSDEKSFPFCFTGIPQHAPVVACECRTPGSHDDDRRAFLRGLQEGVWQVHPQHVVIYGGREHIHWLTGTLPAGPRYTLLDDWMSQRRKHQARQERRWREQNQLNLFTEVANNGRTRKQQWGCQETTHRRQEQRNDQGREGQSPWG